MIENFLNRNATLFLSRCDSDADREWFWMVIVAVRARFNQADIWTTGGEDKQYIDIRIGKKSVEKITGWPVLFIALEPTRIPNLRFHEEVGELQELDRQIDSRSYRTEEQIQTWLNSFDLLGGEKKRDLIGTCKNPIDYARSEVESAVDTSATNAKPNPQAPLNQILYGPPGTGKTYKTIDAALEILDPEFYEKNRSDRLTLKIRFDQLASDGKVSFVTFHQSFSYEDFVEGLRAETDEQTKQITYRVVDGVFKDICQAASVKVVHRANSAIDISNRRVWKMSLGNTNGNDAGIYDECIQNDCILLGYGNSIDFNGCRNREDVVARFKGAGESVIDQKTDYGVTSVLAFISKMKVGDLVVVTDGNLKFRAIGEITGEYQFLKHDEFEDAYSQRRSVKWLRRYVPSLPYKELMNNQFSQMTLYELRSGSIDLDKLAGLLGGHSHRDQIRFSVGQKFSKDYRVMHASADVLELQKPNQKQVGFAMSMIRDLANYVQSGKITLQDIRDKTVFEKIPDTKLEPHLVHGYNTLLPHLVDYLIQGKVADSSDGGSRVLIIDEINRGNVSRIFGELITLIEPSKRADADESLEVVLPYSKEPFSVPSNVYLIGTMNTADRSLAGLDIALRRRFVFQEMPPQPNLLDGINVAGVNIGKLLRIMNERIEVLLDRDHSLGHAYFMGLKNGDQIERLAEIFENQILPLLQEYFFEDWQRICWVLNDHRKPPADCFVQQELRDLNALFGNEVNISSHRQAWKPNSSAFLRNSAYQGIIEVSPSSQGNAIGGVV